MPKVTEKKNKRGQQKPALSKCTINEAEEKNIDGGRGIKQCRSSSLDDHHHHHHHHQQQQNQNQNQERNFCKNCSVELLGEKNPEPFVVSGFLEITPSSSSKSKPYGRCLPLSACACTCSVL